MTKTQNHSSNSPDEPKDNDATLTSFLRQYAPPVPEPSENAEDRLMMAIAGPSASAKDVAPSGTTHRHRSLKRQFALVAGCSALMYGLWQVYQVMMPPSQSAGELAELENFWFQNWDGTANAEDTYPWLTKGDSGLDSAAEPSVSKPTATYFDPLLPRQE